jgi:hypothetical protein
MSIRVWGLRFNGAAFNSWVKKRLENLTVLFLSPGHYVKDEQIVEAVEIYPGKWMRHVIIQNQVDSNEDVNGWFCEACVIFLKGFEETVTQHGRTSGG